MHSKNSTAAEVTQQPTLARTSFGDPLMEHTSQLFIVEEGGDVAQAVETASDLAEGLTQLLMRQHNAVNLGETLYLGEIKALAFLSQTVRALARSATDTLRQQEANQ